MAEESTVLLYQTEPAVQRAADAAERPIPSTAEERVSDGVFTDEQTQAAAVILAMQTGLAIAHNLAMETFLKDDEDKQHLPRRPRRLDEKEQ